MEALDLGFAYSDAKAEAEGIAIVGESGTGKTTLIRHFAEKHPPVRTESGLEVPVLMASTPSAPTPKALAGTLLAAMGAVDADQGTELQRTYRLKRLIIEAKTRIIVLDEFQHIFDRGRHKVMHTVADWIKLLMDGTQATVVICGLPTALTVINSNEQLARRFMAPIQLPRFCWSNQDQRNEFLDILGSFSDELTQVFDMPQLDTDEMAFRLYLASGGLLGYLSKLLRQLLRHASTNRKVVLTLADFDNAHKEAIWLQQKGLDLPRPFAPGLLPTGSEDLFRRVEKIGTLPDVGDAPRRGFPAKRKFASISSVLVAG